MSAMRAEELPELPAELPPPGTPGTPGTPGDARARAAARWTASLDLPAFLDPPAPRPQQPHPRQARPQAANPPLRLTRRGRVVIALAAALVLAALSLVIASAAQATSHPVPARPGQQGLTQVTVRPGQTLWSVAENADPGADTRVVIQQITELNGLAGNVVYAGERLWVPRA